MGLYQKAILLRLTITNSLICQHLKLWCLQKQKLSNTPPTAGDRYQIMHHQLGIDAFVAEAMRLSPNVTPTRAWANTFDFLPPHWHNQQKSASRRAFNRNKPRASHF